MDEGWLDRAKVHGAMILCGAGYGGYFVFSKACLTGGVDPFVFSMYRDCIGCITLFVYASVFERQHWSKISLEIVGLLFAMAIFGVYLQQLLFLIGLKYTNVIFSSLMMNCIPVWTFLIAAIFRIEEVFWCRRDGQAKVLGILFCVCGATILTLYKGPILFGNSTPVSPLRNSLFSVSQVLKLDSWKFGALCLVFDSFVCGAFVNLQVPALRRFPAPLTLMSLTTLLGGFMFAITVFFRMKDVSEIIFSPGPDLIAVIYAGLVASGLCLFFQCWANHKSGPVVVAAYTPMQPIFSAIFGTIFFGNVLVLGSLLGAASIISGLFLVIWGTTESMRLKILSLQIPTHGYYGDATKPTSPPVDPFLTITAPLVQPLLS